jgi:predicted nucleotidyltransferase
MKEKIYNLGREERRKTRKKLEGILKKQEEIEFAYLYGSFIEHLPFHDVDVGVYVGVIQKRETTSCSLDLAQRLSDKLSLPVDVRILNFAPLSFRYHVFRGELISERNEELRSRLMEQTIQKYLDLKPILDRSMKEALVA